jgi:hypothetical protein
MIISIWSTFDIARLLMKYVVSILLLALPEIGSSVEN